MIRIKFFKNKEFLTGFEAVGHSGFAEQGKDIVCAAVSGMTQMTAIALTEIQKLKVDVKKDDKKGYLLCKLSKKASEEEIHKAQDILKALKISLEGVKKEYKKYISLEVKDEIY